MTDHLGELLGVNPISLGLAAMGGLDPAWNAQARRGFPAAAHMRCGYVRSGGSREVGEEPVLQGNRSQPREPG